MLIFNPHNHTYTLNGKPIPSVTKILGCLRMPALETWRGKVGNERADQTRKESADLGTRVHAVVESINRATHGYLPDGTLDVAASLLPFGEAYLDWFHREVEDVVAVELPVYSEQHWYAGTLDVVLRLRGRPGVALVDLKTSKGDYPHPEWGLQTVAYQVGLMESAGIVTTSRVVVQLPSDRPGVLVVHELPIATARGDWEVFQACLRIARWQEAGRAPRHVGRLVDQEGRNGMENTLAAAVPE